MAKRGFHRNMINFYGLTKCIWLLVAIENSTAAHFHRQSTPFTHTPRTITLHGNNFRFSFAAWRNRTEINYSSFFFSPEIVSKLLSQESHLHFSPNLATQFVFHNRTSTPVTWIFPSSKTFVYRPHLLRITRNIQLKCAHSHFAVHFPPNITPNWPIFVANFFRFVSNKNGDCFVLSLANERSIRSTCWSGQTIFPIYLQPLQFG